MIMKTNRHFSIENFEIIFLNNIQLLCEIIALVPVLYKKSFFKKCM